MRQSYVELNYLIWKSQAYDKCLTLAFSLQLFHCRKSWESSVSLSSTTLIWKHKFCRRGSRWCSLLCPPDLARFTNWEGRSGMSNHTEWGEAFWKGNELRVQCHVFLSMRIFAASYPSGPRFGAENSWDPIGFSMEQSGSYSCAERNILKLWSVSFHEPLRACHLPACFSLLLFLMTVVHEANWESWGRRQSCLGFLRGTVLEMTASCRPFMLLKPLAFSGPSS